MEEICRLCCSTKFVNNYIFDEENALYLKMSLYLPIKVFKNDRLPQKVCDRCSCKVNDFYQFCNETIEVQNRLRTVFLSTAVHIENSIDLTLIKHNALSPPPPLTDFSEEHKVEPGTEHSDQKLQNQIAEFSKRHESLEVFSNVQRKSNCDQSTQTEIETDEPVPNELHIEIPLYTKTHIKEEPKQSSEVKTEDEFPSDNFFYTDQASDNNSEDDMSLLQFQKKKRSKKVKVANGGMSKRKRKKNEVKDDIKNEWNMLMHALPSGAALTMVEGAEADMKVDVKQELPELGLDVPKVVKSEPEEFNCCICFIQYYSRSEMLQHYKEHGAAADELPVPAPPPPPDTDPVKCPRCQKRLEAGAWAGHWARHWERDRRPYRCTLCEKTFRDHHQILKHGLTHKLGGAGGAGGGAPAKRYVCDVCPEAFVYMRCLLAHRARAHPEAGARALLLRCAECARQFAHLNSLRRHMRAHSGERNFLCNICGKALSSREHLKFHIRIHTGYKPNVCKTCGKAFVKKCNLTLHERVHSGERPHVCSVCGKAFSQRSTLVIHERYHSGARPYVCALCQRGFVAKGLLSMHLKTTCI